MFGQSAQLKLVRYCTLITHILSWTLDLEFHLAQSPRSSSRAEQSPQLRHSLVRQISFFPDSQMLQVELIVALEERHAFLLSQMPDLVQKHYWRRHLDASSEPGSNKWSFPSPVLDEAAWRKDQSSLKQSNKASVSTQPL